MIPPRNIVRHWVAPIAIGNSSLIKIETSVFIRRKILEGSHHNEVKKKHLPEKLNVWYMFVDFQGKLDYELVGRSTVRPMDPSWALQGGPRPAINGL